MSILLSLSCQTQYAEIIKQHGTLRIFKCKENIDQCKIFLLFFFQGLKNDAHLDSETVVEDRFGVCPLQGMVSCIDGKGTRVHKVYQRAL